jgi:hypothetical protein
MSASIAPLAHLRALLGSWPGRFIFVFVLVQLALPLRYYLAPRDPHDERFAWRMFSPMRMATCTASATVDDVPLPLGGRFHEAWLELLRRGRFVVIERMAAALCAERPGRVVRFALDCTYLDRPPQSYGGFDLCTVPEL